MRYRSLIPGMLGGVPFDAGSILELSEESAATWVEQMCMTVCDDQTVSADLTGQRDEVPTQPQLQMPPDSEETAPEAPEPPAEAPAEETPPPVEELPADDDEEEVQ